MTYYLIKIAITACLVVLISEIARRSSLMGALLASVPVTSVLAMVWLFHETGDLERIGRFSTSIFWLVIPSLVLFIVLPLLLKLGSGFYPALAVSIVMTAASYALMVVVLGRYGITL